MPKYYLLNRPPFIGTHPEGETAREVWQPVQDIPPTPAFPKPGYAHGWVEYATVLTFEQVWKYDMTPENELERILYDFWRAERKDIRLGMDYLFDYAGMDPKDLERYGRDWRAVLAKRFVELTAPK